MDTYQYVSTWIWNKDSEMNIIDINTMQMTGFMI